MMMLEVFSLRLAQKFAGTPTPVATGVTLEVNIKLALEAATLVQDSKQAGSLNKSVPSLFISLFIPQIRQNITMQSITCHHFLNLYFLHEFQQETTKFVRNRKGNSIQIVAENQFGQSSATIQIGVTGKSLSVCERFCREH